MEFSAATDDKQVQPNVEVLIGNYESLLERLNKQNQLPRYTTKLPVIKEAVEHHPAEIKAPDQKLVVESLPLDKQVQLPQYTTKVSEANEVVESKPAEIKVSDPRLVVESFQGINCIVNELMSNEAIYVKNLSLGIQNYVQPMDDPELSAEIRDSKLEIFGNIKEIYNLHAASFYPALQSCNLNVTKIAETFTEFVKYGDFYCYILFMLGRERALLLCKKYKKFFDELRTKCEDKLDVSSFLLQPVQRLPRYQLLLTEVIKELSKHGAKVDLRQLLGTVCFAEKTVQRLLVMSNESLSINEIVQDDLPIDLLGFGQFLKMGIFTIYDRVRQRKYMGKLFYFEQLLVYTESVAMRLEYRGHYLGDEFGLSEYDANKKFCLFAKRLGEHEVEFWASIQQLEEWYSLLVKSLMDFSKSEKRKLGRPRTYVDAGQN